MTDRDAIVIYASQTGFTARYALWIAEKLECPFIKYQEASVPALKHYKTLIFGGWLNAGRITGIDYVKKHIAEFSEQEVVLFCTGAAPAEEQDLDKIREVNLGEELADVPLYYLPGGMRPDRLKGVSRMVIKIVAKAKSKNDPQAAERYRSGFDLGRPEYVEPLVERIKNNKE